VFEVKFMHTVVYGFCYNPRGPFSSAKKSKTRVRS
jgi:hypothetical protein